MDSSVQLFKVSMLIDYKLHRHQRKMSSPKKLLTCKGTLRQVFIRVYKLEIQSPFSLVQLSPSPPPSLCQSTVCMDSELQGEGGVF
jgi:hypothetical protein